MVRKYAKKQFRRAKKYLKKRYIPGGKLDVQKIASDVWKLKSIINSELKHQDTEINNANIPLGNSNWLIYSLNDLSAQDGVDPGEREGMAVRFKSLQIQGSVRQTAGNGGIPTRIKMVIFVDKQPMISGLGVIPPVSQLYRLGANTHYVDGMRQWDSIQQKRFSVLYSRVFTLDGDYPERTFKIYKKLDMVTQWANGYVSGTAQQRNKLYIAFFSDVVSGTEVGVVDYASRVTYRDN